MAYYYLLLSLKANNKYNAVDSIAKKYIQIGNDESVISLVRNESVFITTLKKYPDTSYYKVKNFTSLSILNLLNMLHHILTANCILFLTD